MLPDSLYSLILYDDAQLTIREQNGEIVGLQQDFIFRNFSKKSLIEA
jgi:hypothetical protein